jgi:hypothetical protein
MAKAWAMATATMWAMVTAMRLAGNKKGKGGHKGNGNGNVRVAGDKEGEGSKAMAMVMAMVTRMAGKLSATVKKRLMVTATRVAGKRQQRQRRG